MEKPIAHKITLRLKPTADTLLQISDNNHKKEVKYYARDNSIHKLTVDHMYILVYLDMLKIVQITSCLLMY